MSEQAVAPVARERGVVPLSKPIEAHGETLGALTLREPGGKDIRLNGVPYRIGAEDGSIIIDAAVVHRYIVALAGVPLSVVDRLPPADWSAAMSAVLDFFGVTPGPS
jgi:hypothetical protein